MSQPLDYAKANAENFRQQLFELLRIPSVSTLPERAGAVRQSAEWLAENLRNANLENVAIMETGGHPIVYADWLHAEGQPTVLIYGHYDVQPADMVDGWTHDPFDPIIKDGKVYARGSSDDKGQAFAHIKAVESYLQTVGTLPVNVKFVIEGEEEIGSPHFPPFLAEHKDLLSADYCIISDSGILTEEQPSIVYALRGLVAMDVEVQGAGKDLHSGGYGGTIHNAAQAIAEIVAKLHDENGIVTVPGFYDDVKALSAEERAELAKTNIDESAWLEQAGAPAIWGDPEYTIRERIGARPTLEINGIAGGFYGDGVKTVLPAKAIAKITCRLVADQDPFKIFDLIKAYIESITPDSVKVKVTIQKGSGYPALVDINNPAIQAATLAYEKGFGAKPVFMREGGSIPIVAEFQQTLGLPVVLMGMGLNTDGAHGPDEHFTLSMFHKGIDTSIHFLNELKG